LFVTAMHVTAMRCNSLRGRLSWLVRSAISWLHQMVFAHRRHRARTLLTEGWVVPSVCAARVKLRSCRTTFNILRSRSRKSALFRSVMIIIPNST
jgi:hypothetical protein